MIDLPKQIKIGDKFLKVLEKKEIISKDGTKGYWGLYNYDVSIFIAKKHPNEKARANTFVHETLHAINDNVNLLQKPEEKDMEEDVVTRISNQLCMVLNDNPDILRYLTEVYK